MGENASGIAASPRLMARIAGVVYLIIAVGALFLPFVAGPSGITGMSLAEAPPSTLAKIESARSAYVLSGAAQAFLGVCDMGLAWFFYELMRPVDRGLALLAASFRFAFATINSANLFNYFAPLLLLTGSGYLAAFQMDQLEALARMFLKLRVLGLDIALLFFGVHLLLLGWLMARSTFFPRVVGVLVALSGLAYLANIFVHAISPALRALLFPYAMLVLGPGEILLILWLIVVGVNAEKWKARASAAGLAA
jgi:hypothetical protein